LSELGITVYDDPTGDSTLYTVFYDSGARIVDIHELINRHLDHAPTIRAVHLITPKGDSIPVTVSGEDVEWEIIPVAADTVCLEYLLYNEPEDGEAPRSTFDPDRGHWVLVDAFPAGTDPDVDPAGG
jgi:hypothetical protein